MITTPIAANNNSLLCLWKPYQGVFMHTVLSTHTVTVQYGVNSSDQQVDNATTCGDGGGIYITVTSGVSATKTRFIGYW
jgi:hypothetical protein